jgi:hypothetical protein
MFAHHWGLAALVIALACRASAPPHFPRIRQHLHTFDASSKSHIVCHSLISFHHVRYSLIMTHNPNFVDKPLRLTSHLCVTASIDNHQPEEDRAEVFAPIGSIYDIPRSPTPPERHSIAKANGNPHIHGNRAPVQQHSDPVPFAHRLLKAGPVLCSKAKTFRTPRGSSSTRKRHLPVNELALLRTTTSDGLPQPGVRGFHGGPDMS